MYTHTYAVAGHEPANAPTCSCRLGRSRWRFVTVSDDNPDIFADEFHGAKFMIIN